MKKKNLLYSLAILAVIVLIVSVIIYATEMRLLLSSDHVVPCLGGCGDMVGPDRVEDYHKRICETDESFIGCGQTYRSCSKTQKLTHSRLGERCPHAPHYIPNL